MNPTQDDITKLLGQIGDEHKTLRGESGALKTDLNLLRNDITALKSGQDPVAKAIESLQRESADLRRLGLAGRTAKPARRGCLRDDTALGLGCAMSLLLAEKGGWNIDGKQLEDLKGFCREVLGVNTKATLTTSDIPQLVQYANEVAELVGMFGVARQVGTVFPMGADTLNLPSLLTDPSFGIIGQAGAVTEKSPQYSLIALVAKKWGGIVRYPREIEMGAVAAFGQFIARYGARNFAFIEDDCFFNADGTGTYGTLNGLRKVVDVVATTEVHIAGGTANNSGTLANMRAVRSKVASSALRVAAYYFHVSFENKLSGFNSAGDKPYRTVGARNAELGVGGGNGLVMSDATFDGFPIVWVDVMPTLSATASLNQVYGLFGDASFMYFGDRMKPEVAVSDQAYWTTDELGVRFLERFGVASLVPQLLGKNAMSGLKTAAS